MRKLVSILFLCIIFSSQVGYYLVYIFQQYQLHETVKQRLFAGLPDSAFETIVAGEHSSFSWEEEGREFYQNGELYDVAKSVVKDGKLILYCINDRNEAALLSRLGKSADTSGHSKQVLKIQLIAFLQEMPVTSQSSKPICNQLHRYFNAPLYAPDEEVVAPPPRATVICPGIA